MTRDPHRVTILLSYGRAIGGGGAGKGLRNVGMISHGDRTPWTMTTAKKWV